RAITGANPGGPSIAGFRDGKLRLGRSADAREIASAEIIGDYFGVLALQPSLGRFFTDQEARAESFEPVAVISYHLWVREYAGVSSVIGAPLDLGTHRYTIIGVAPDDFHGLGLDATDV